jgi:tol-pal system protein YbgF
MNVVIRMVALGAVLAAVSPGALAQRASLAERVAVLEQQAAANRGNTDLLRQVTLLKEEVQALRAQVEELQHAQEQAREAGRNQYLDIDSRLIRLEGGTAPATVPGVPTAAHEMPPPAAAATAADAGAALPPPPPAPVKVGDAERAAYEAAFAVLKAGQYDASARQFADFLQQFPQGALAPNALYWLGESYYATQNYELAAAQYRSLLQRYPGDQKAPGALLKLGLSQYGLGQQAEAEATLAQVGSRYPDTDAARTAADRLRAMQLSSLR